VKIGVTDADMFSGLKDFVYVIAEPEQRRALVSVRRIKEAFWKRKSDPPRQQTRLVKELLGAIALAHGAPPCENPTVPHLVRARPPRHRSEGRPPLPELRAQGQGRCVEAVGPARRASNPETTAMKAKRTLAAPFCSRPCSRERCS
jgi:hypothetical protein